VADRVPRGQEIRTDQLRGDADVAVAVLHEVLALDRPGRLQVVATGYVQPLDDDRAVELSGAAREAHEHAALIRRLHAPGEVRGRARIEVLVLGIAVARARQREDAVVPRI